MKGKSRFRKNFERKIKQLKLKGSVLDMRAGSTRYFPDTETLDIDSSKDVTYPIDVHDMDFKNKYDNILCFNLLEHCKNPKKVVRNIYNALKAGGKVYIVVPFVYRYHSVGKFKGDKDYWRFTDDGLRVLLKDFKILKIEPLVKRHWLFSFYFWSRSVQFIEGYFAVAEKPALANSPS